MLSEQVKYPWYLKTSVLERYGAGGCGQLRGTWYRRAIALLFSLSIRFGDEEND